MIVQCYSKVCFHHSRHIVLSSTSQQKKCKVLGRSLTFANVHTFYTFCKRMVHLCSSFAIFPITNNYQLPMQYYQSAQLFCNISNLCKAPRLQSIVNPGSRSPKQACHAWMKFDYDDRGDDDERFTIWWLLKKICHAWMNFDFIAERIGQHVIWKYLFGNIFFGYEMSRNLYRIYKRCSILS